MAEQTLTLPAPSSFFDPGFFQIAELIWGNFGSTANLGTIDNEFLVAPDVNAVWAYFRFGNQVGIGGIEIRTRSLPGSAADAGPELTTQWEQNWEMLFTAPTGETFEIKASDLVAALDSNEPYLYSEAFDSAILQSVYNGITSNASVWNVAGVTLRMRDGPPPSTMIFAVEDVEIEAIFVGDIEIGEAHVGDVTIFD